jgi:hypothetical protein
VVVAVVAVLAVELVSVVQQLSAFSQSEFEHIQKIVMQV